MFIRALIAFLALPGVVAGIVPLFIVGRDARLAKTAPGGIVLLSIGFSLLLWCVRDFYVSGKGTLAPAFARRHPLTHWLAEQALAWSGLPVITVRPTVFLEGFFLRLAAASVKERDELALPLGNGKTSPISAVDVARAVSVILEDPAPHVGRAYNLTGFESASLDHYAGVFSKALGRAIRYRNAPLSTWTHELREAGVSAHVISHLAVMADLHVQGRYDRMTVDLFRLTGKTATSMHDFVTLHASEFTRREGTA